MRKSGAYGGDLSGRNVTILIFFIYCIFAISIPFFHLLNFYSNFLSHFLNDNPMLLVVDDLQLKEDKNGKCLLIKVYTRQELEKGKREWLYRYFLIISFFSLLFCTVHNTIQDSTNGIDTAFFCFLRLGQYNEETSQLDGQLGS